MGLSEIGEVIELAKTIGTDPKSWFTEPVLEKLLGTSIDILSESFSTSVSSQLIVEAFFQFDSLNAVVIHQGRPPAIARYWLYLTGHLSGCD